jgi:hypothetical protein
MEVWLAIERADADFVTESRLVEWKSPELSALVSADLAHLIVKSWHAHSSNLILKTSE